MQEKEERTESKKCSVKGILSFIAVIFQSMSMSVIIPLGNLSPYLISYLHIYSDSIGLGNGYFLLPIMILFLFVFAAFGGPLERNLGVRITLLIGQAILVSGTVLMYFSKSIYLVYFIMILYGAGLGFSNLVMGKNLYMYYPNIRGLITGVISSSITLGAAVFNIIGELLINKTHAQPEPFYPEEVAKNIKFFYLLQMSVIGIFSILAAILVVPYQEPANESNEVNTAETYREAAPTPVKEGSGEFVKKISQIDNEHLIPSKERTSEYEKPRLSTSIDNENKEENEEEEKKEKEIANKKRNERVFEALKSWRILKLMIISFTMTLGIGTILTTYRVVGIENKISEEYLQRLGIFILGTTFIFNPAWGIMADYVDFRYSMTAMNIFGIAVASGIYFTLKNNFLYSIIIITASLLNCAHSVISPHIMKVFGIETSIELIAVVSMASNVSSLIGSTFAYFVDKSFNNSPIAYLVIYIVGGLCSIVSLALSLSETEKPFEYKV